MFIEKILDEMSRVADGNSLLENKTYENMSFGDFSLIPKIGSTYTIQNCSFKNINIEKGGLYLAEGCNLRNVTFHNFGSKCEFNIESNVNMENVTIVGSNKPKALYISNKRTDLSVNDENGIELDISQYSGAVSIVGVATDKIIINRENNALIKAEILRSVDWGSGPISKLSWWKIAAKKVDLSGVQKGVFSLPSKKSKSYETAALELVYLRKEGYVE